MEDIVEEFMRIKQDGTTREYQDKFEEFRIKIEKIMPSLREECFLSVFIGRLNDDIRPMVRIIKPNTLSQAFHVAKFQEKMVKPIAN